MSKNRRQHQASDIRISYDSDKFKKIDTLWRKYHGDSYAELLLLLALYGIKHDRRIPLDQRNVEEGEEHNFSRTVYQRSEVEMHSMMGLITILANLEGNKEEILNQKAFARMYNYNLPYAKLPNVQTFYQSILGGIQPLYNLLTELGNTPQDIAVTIYDEIIEDDSKFSLLVAELIADEQL